MLLSPLQMAKLLGVLVLFYVLHREHAMRLTCRVCRSLAGLAQTLRLHALTNALLGAARAAQAGDPLEPVEREARRQAAQRSSAAPWPGLKAREGASDTAHQIDPPVRDEDLPGLSEASRRMLAYHRERAARARLARQGVAAPSPEERLRAHVAARRGKAKDARERHQAVRQRLRKSRAERRQDCTQDCTQD